jgi:hypothetical protein
MITEEIQDQIKNILSDGGLGPDTVELGYSEYNELLKLALYKSFGLKRVGRDLGEVFGLDIKLSSNYHACNVFRKEVA